MLALPLVTVLSIGDGDTLTVLSTGQRQHVRLACIDAPEMAQGPAGAAARNALRALVPPGSPLTLLGTHPDRYGRTVAVVLRPGASEPVNLTLVRQGQAFVYPHDLRGCPASRYRDAEAAARAARRGIWGPDLGYDLMLPWDYRACVRQRHCR